MSSTVYDVKVKYTLDDSASKGLKGIGSAADKAAGSAFSLKSALAAVGGVALLHKGKELLLDFNTEMDKLKNSMTTVMQMNLHMPFQKAAASADDLFETFQAMAKKSPLLTSDFMEMAAAIAPAIATAGGGLEKIKKITQGSLQAGLAFGISPHQMQMDIQEMLNGAVRITSRTIRPLLASQGLDHLEFNAKSSKERAMITEKILTDPALLQAAQRAAHTMSGEFSTIKDNVQITFGEIGRPMMDRITAQFRQINVWIEEHPRLIKDWATSFSETLTKGFTYFQEVASFFVDHQQVLFSLAKAFLVLQGGKLASSFITGGLTKLDHIASAVSTSLANYGQAGIGGVVKGFGGMIPVIGTTVTALSALAAGLTLAGDILSHNNEKQRAQMGAMNESSGAFGDRIKRRDQIEKMLAGGVSADLRPRLTNELSTLNSALKDPEKLGEALKTLNEASLKQGGAGLRDLTAGDLRNPVILQKLFPGLDTFASDPTENANNRRIFDTTMQLLGAVAGIPQELSAFTGAIKQQSQGNDLLFQQAMKFVAPDQFGMPTPKETKSPTEGYALGKGEINVNIQRVEVASEDPDRFVFGLVQVAENGIRHATQSAHTLPGGF